eukprot:CAMPEP_0194084916 /NCGR_PEP_ID=MMETSP0149-20130528/15347_1 /TAXON_ID=122233 /ORGANISM="Chaetoceros debilis, Strain MM31A-1" /LENGTH=351 /DNA_ID=CAMNT_0038767679 /DNA_START=280 /DNA_END=1335 /DNA_ORIENTATION=+
MHNDEEDVNKFVQYREFGLYATENSRVIAIDEIPVVEKSSDVIVKVKASTVSINDCFIRRGIWNDSIKLPTTPGFDVVGTIVSMGVEAETAGFDYGEAVAACCRVGGNARYITLHYGDLCSVPGNVDSSQAACIISTYMTAYQALHRCKPRGPRETLEGSNILVTGGNSPIGQAIIELAHRAGASKIFATAPKKVHEQLHDKGVCPLPLDAKMWLPLVRGKMDIVIDGICQDGYSSPHAALNYRGHLVVIGMNLIMNGAERGYCGTPMDAMIQSFKAGYLLSRTTRYDVYESSKLRPAEWKHDIEYLMELLARRKINPVIEKRVTLDAVPFTQQQLEAGEIEGLVVCKPWK